MNPVAVELELSRTPFHEFDLSNRLSISAKTPRFATIFIMTMTRDAAAMMDFEGLISQRAQDITLSGIRRVFELGAKLKDPINLSIGQPDFPVPDALKQAAIAAIENDHNGYTLTQGVPSLLNAVSRRLKGNIGWDVPSDDIGVMVTSGTSGAILLASMALLNPGDEIIMGDPYFVAYPPIAALAAAKAVMVDTYPDFRLTAERIEPHVTARTKILLLNSPGNPSGVVLSEVELRDIVDLCEQRGVLIISDEIYDEFTYADARTAIPAGSQTRAAAACPSPARMTKNMLLVRGFGKTYGCTGWRLGYAAGPRPIIQQMLKLQQFSYVCAPSMAQYGAAVAFDVDMSSHVARYQKRRDNVVAAFTGVAEIVSPGGAFYAFIKVPPHLGLTATQFTERAIEQSVLLIPGSVFSRRDTHFRLSFAVADDRLAKGLEILRGMMG